MALNCMKNHTQVIFKRSMINNSTATSHKRLFPLFTPTRTLTQKFSRPLSDETINKLLLFSGLGNNARSGSRHLKVAARSFMNSFNEYLTVLSQQFARHCRGIVTQRIRRGAQSAKLYRGLGYDRRYVAEVLKSFSKSVYGHRNRFFGVFAAVAFNWKDEQITEDEVHEVESEIGRVNRQETNKTAQLEKYYEKDWEKVIDRPKLLAWRKPVPGSSFYQYKLYGTVDDLPAKAFYNAQIDIEYRKNWDKLVIKLDVVDRDRENRSEVVHWVSHFPYPMYPREYVYIRKFKVDLENNLLYTMARSCHHPGIPHTDKYVRVETYLSHMVIRPYKSFDEDGFDYILTYYDEPKSNFPTFAYNWIASSGVPDFVEQMYAAARHLHQRGNTYHEQDTQFNKKQVPL